MRIGIVNDMPMAVELLRRLVVSTREHQVAWMATNGREAVEACRRDLPDLILMDLAMPEMDGVEATRKIMAETPCSILLVTASIEANVAGVYEAMGHGALDAVDIPSVGIAGNASSQSARLLTNKIATIGKLVRDAPSKASERISVAADPSPQRLVAIGASAGGPAAVAKVLSAFPIDFGGAIVLVQHLDAQFIPGLADWLGQHTPLPIRAAQEKDRPQTGTVLVASSDDHLVFKSAQQLGYTSSPKDNVYRPSVDVFFESAAQWWPGSVIGVLLTGMGRDGARGLKQLRDKGHLTIAQDEATSAVYGMPKAAAAIGAAVDILPLSAIGLRIIEACGRPT
ncbi:chemotaxis response regulator protein-glutamate methylesterase [Mesorhizobium sp. B2-3-10]|uniref:chemotaxis response regulator protein-glutamate methylesterase n=1 Tax=Mesorhizobium sp. B2-3-10 TaxID=2589954 RepID=UPI001126AD99|nr:chemotaxis response regulator protein-glutamate methylesterase [Mesorhizobium sp. B2-3-10]TPL99677.1 chemotaxis response regulator protein-glutamate methylesterase [Mesorhizobium sp. B2-3-10]